MSYVTQTASGGYTRIERTVGLVEREKERERKLKGACTMYRVMR